MLSWFKQLVSTKASPAAIQTPAHLRIEVLKKNIPTYPPFLKGLPLEQPQDLLDTQADLIGQIYGSAKTTREVFEKHYMGALKRVAEFVHLLPASQSHHHRGAGGLLNHSIEVGLWSLREADKMLLQELFKTPGHRREVEPRWLLTVFLAGLCHDIGKPMTDLEVHNFGGSKQWIPTEHSLWAWGQKEGVDAYFLKWRNGRAKQHIAMTSMLATSIIGNETITWIQKESPQLIVWLNESFNGNPGNVNPLYEIVIRNDQKSVERDLKGVGAAMAGYDLGVPVERIVTDMMRGLVRRGLWQVNEPGAKVWCIDGIVYLSWPLAGQDLITEIRKESVPSVPRDIDSLLDLLIERGLALSGPEGLYKIAPAVLEAKIPSISIPCIRLRDDALVSASPLASVPGRLLNSSAASATLVAPEKEDRQESEARPVHEDLQTQREAEGRLPPHGQAKASPVSAPAPTVRAERVVSVPLGTAPAMTVDPQTGEILDAPTQPPRKQHIEAGEPPHETPSSAGGREEASESTPTAQRSEPKEQSNAYSAPERRAEQKPATTKREKPTIVFEGLIGEAFKALAEDIKTGAKVKGRDLIEEPDGRVVLRWPDAFAGYGLTTSAIIAELSSKNWCAEDPLMPNRKVLEIQSEGEIIRGIRLHHDISDALLYAIDPRGFEAVPTKGKAAAPSNPTPGGPTRPFEPPSPLPKAPAQAAPIDAHDERAALPQDTRKSSEPNLKPVEKPSNESKKTVAGTSPKATVEAAESKEKKTREAPKQPSSAKNKPAATRKTDNESSPKSEPTTVDARKNASRPVAINQQREPEALFQIPKIDIKAKEKEILLNILRDLEHFGVKQKNSTAIPVAKVMAAIKEGGVKDSRAFMKRVVDDNPSELKINSRFIEAMKR